MTSLIEKALKAITRRTNLSTGLAHPNDMNAAKEMFIKLHEAGEELLAQEISSWAVMNGWQEKDAKQLGTLAQQIGQGKKVRTSYGPFWRDDILEILNEED